ncbi:MAG: hypothetical protein NWR54_02710 [Paracoccaceae bacterium]|nr:hypothetical protein [Paracoccaceae bacterium]
MGMALRWQPRLLVADPENMCYQAGDVRIAVNENGAKSSAYCLRVIRMAVRQPYQGMKSFQHIPTGCQHGATRTMRKARFMAEPC